jgi:hypothetical protein
MSTTLAETASGVLDRFISPAWLRDRFRRRLDLDGSCWSGNLMDTADHTIPRA